MSLLEILRGSLDTRIMPHSGNSWQQSKSGVKKTYVPDHALARIRAASADSRPILSACWLSVLTRFGRRSKFYWW